MAPRRTRLLAWSAAAAGVVVVAAALAPFLVDVDRFRPTLERNLSGAVGSPVHLGRLRLTLWTGPGVTADGIRVDAPSPEGSGFEAPALKVRLAAFPLLRGAVEARHVGVRSGVVTRAGKSLVHDLDLDARVVLAPGGGPATAVGRLEGAFDALPGAPHASVSFHGRLENGKLTVDPLTVEAGRARLEGSATVEGVRSGSPRGEVKARVLYLETRAEGRVEFQGNPDGTSLRFDLAADTVDFDAIAALFSGDGAVRRASLFPAAYAAPVLKALDRDGFLARLRGDGRLSAKRARWQGLEVERFASDVRLSSGAARLENAAFEAYGGRGEGTLSARVLEPEVPFHVSSRLDGVRLQPVLAAFSRDLAAVVEGTGSVAADLDGAARGDLARSLRGTAVVKVERGKIRSIGLMKQVARILEMAGGRGIGRDETPFERASAAFAVADGVARTSDLQFRSADLDLDGGGSVTVDGALAFDVTSTFSREATADLLRKTPQLRFRVGGDGRLSAPMQVRGTARAPTVQLDLDRVLREGLEHELKNEGAKGLLKRLLGK